MTLSSLEFLFLFAPITLAIYLAFRSTTWRNIVLFAASVVFYTWGEPVFIVLMLATVLLNYVVGLLLSPAQGGWRRFWLVVGIVGNLLPLALFKYAGFFVGSIAPLVQMQVPAVDLPLPLGISFYTFMALAYLIDLSRGSYPAERNPVKMTLAIAAFPVVTSGPIARYGSLREQLISRDVTTSDFAAGLRRVLIGLGKKVLIANNVGFVASQIFRLAPDQYGALGAWVGALAWTLQLYFDFSGYTDMAVGLGRMMGLVYPENFNYPYIARSASDFWRRWHMSLSSWFRDYVYIPLGGNRVSTPRWVLNMAIVWSLTGLWHGASWTFVAWGCYYGVVLVAERLVWGKALARAPRALQHVYAIVVIVAGWVLFMSPTIGVAGDVLASMVGLHGFGSAKALVLVRVVQPLYLGAFAAAILGATPWWRSPKLGLTDRPALGWAFDMTLVAVFVISAALVVVKTFNPFIYVRF